MYFQKPDNYNILLKHPKISKKSPLFDKFNLPKSPININGKKNQLNTSAVNQSFSHQIQPKSREESFSPIMYIRGNSNGYTGNTINTLMTQPNNNNDILAENRLNSDAGLPLIQPYKEKLTNQYIEQNYINNLTQQQKVYNQYQSQPPSHSQNVSLEKEKTVNYNLIKLSDLNTNHYKTKVSQSHQKNSTLVNKKYGAISNINNKNNGNYDNNLNVISSTSQVIGNNQNILQKQQQTSAISNINTNRNNIHPSSTTQVVEEIIKNGSLVQNSNQINKQNSSSNPNSNFQSKAELQKIETTPLLEQNATFSQKQIETHLYSQGDILLSQIDLEPLGGNDNKKYNSQMGSFNNLDDQLMIFNKDKLFLNQNSNNLSMKGSTLNIQFMNNSYNNADLLSINNDILSVCNDKLSLYETASQGNTVYLNNNNNNYILNQNDSSSFLTRSMCDNCTLPNVNMLSQVSDGLDSSTLPSSMHYANYLQNNLIQRRKNSKQISDDLLGNSNSHNSTTLDETKPQQIFSAFPQQRRNSFRKRNVYSVHQPHHNYQLAPQQYNQNQIQSDRRHNNQRLEITAQFQQVDQKERTTKDKQHMKLSEVVNRAGEVLNTKYLQEEIIIDSNDKKNQPIEKQTKSSENSFQDKNFSFFQAQQQNEKQQASKQMLKDKASQQQNQQQQQKQYKSKEASKSAHQTPKNVNDLNLQIFSSGVNSQLNSRRNISPPKVLPVIQIEKENDHSVNRIELDFQKQKKQTNTEEPQITKFKGRRFKSIDNQKINNILPNNLSSYQPSPFEIESKYNNEK
ncbi:hypothetical protein TTHERM_01020800 (macronuclear) [Tetrahymena thermophila SB210]|uniref:Uncharacterized protein n=1 Tax=Tetrahymena thermophila (strain SB210) TaxID=312017 RepID=Q24BZ0_TETTS|nr:hypothetical protein TTHERM_01020800 [Tetrahymena thermophila SB210]EAS05312.2 hypothetical protein TTHERM_01020800 [Tetrahymena thermophila SB210]|eukprot:XP_001025557.2 hypothetical protein TTHERM_01020800 [Tetrahymena thermophila SB210]